jgi:hypothetical protein
MCGFAIAAVRKLMFNDYVHVRFGNGQNIAHSCELELVYLSSSQIIAWYRFVFSFVGAAHHHITPFDVCSVKTPKDSMFFTFTH